MRIFIAIDFSEEIKESLAQAEAHLKYSGADVKWVEKDNIHLTLKFLGEVDEKKVEEIKAILDNIASGTRPFETTIKDLGAFPKIEYPRVVWGGIDKGAGELKIIAEKVDEALSKLGFEKETRSFAAHLTIGRVRSPKNKEKLKEKMLSYKLSAVSCKINEIVLFKSTLTPKGSIYTKLHEAKLLGA
jgi:2'-5' RNA ligase